MGRNPKYLIIDDPLAGEYPIIFPYFIDHGRHTGFEQDSKFIVAAGFLQITTEAEKIKFSCYGESTSLKLKSRGEIDAKIIERSINHDMGF